MPASAQPQVIEWYRPRLLGPLLLRWLAATALLSVGVLGIGLAWDGSGRVPPDLKPWALGAGVVGTVLGAVGGIVGIIKLVSENDRYLLVRSDGVEVSTGSGAVRFLAWSSLAGAQVERRRVVLRDTNGATLRLPDAYQGIGADALAERILDCRRKALLGALKPTPLQRR